MAKVRKPKIWRHKHGAHERGSPRKGVYASASVEDLHKHIQGYADSIARIQASQPTQGDKYFWRQKDMLLSMQRWHVKEMMRALDAKKALIRRGK